MRKISLALAVVLVPVVVSGCGLGGDAVTVGDTSISQDSFSRWVETTSRSMQNGKEDKTYTPDAPDFGNCIAEKKKAAASTQPPSDQALKSLCKSVYDAARQEALKTVVMQAWVIEQSKKQGIKAPDAQVDQQLASLKQQVATSDGGVNDEDLRQHAKEIILTQLLRQKAETAKVAAPTNAQLQAYYTRHIQQFNRLPSRDLNMLIAKNRTQAAAAKRALQAGSSWSTVYKKYNTISIWGASKSLQVAATPPSFQPVLAKALFEAPVGPVIGPVRVATYDNGWTVFQVRRSSPGSAARPFGQIKGEVKQNYISSMRIAAADRALSSLRSTWQPQTECDDDLKNFYPCQGIKAPKGS